MQHINSFLGGMKRAIDYSLMPQDSYRYMLNGHLVSRNEHGYVVTGLKGNKSIAEFGLDECPIGSVSSNGILYIITHKIVNNSSSVCFYTIKGSIGNGWTSKTMLPLPYKVGASFTPFVISNSVLKFDRGKLLEVLAKNSYDGSIDLYIGDGLNLNVVINTGLDRNGKFTKRKYPSLDNISLFEQQKSIDKVPTITGTIKDNGNLKPGSYFVYVRYLDESLNVTPFIAEAGPFFIHAGSQDRNTLSGVFNENNALVNKAISIKITNADIYYKKLNVAVVYYFGNNGLISRENYLLDKTYVLDANNSCNITIDGLNKKQTIVLEELYRDNLPLNKNETHIQHDDHYVGANWSGIDIDYTKLKELASKFIPHAVLKNESNFDKVCDENCSEFEYKEDEVYPLGVSFLIEGQYKTPVFPICGWYEGYVKSEDGTTLPSTIYTEGTKTTLTMIEFGVIWTNKKSNYEYDENDKYSYEGIIEIRGAGETTSNVIIKFSNTEEPVMFKEINFPQGVSDYITFAYTSNKDVTFESIITSKQGSWQDSVHYYKLGANQGSPTKTTSDNSSSILSQDNGKGLYKFPLKKLLTDVVSEYDLHFRLMGLRIEDFKAEEYYWANKSNLPKITAIYFVQGKRIENFITQGLSIATVKAVGFSSSFGTGSNKVDISEFIALGDGVTKCHFPYLDASNYPLFPVMTINTQSPMIAKKFIQYIGGVSQLRVGNNEEFKIDANGKTIMQADSITYGSNNDLFRSRLTDWTYLNNLESLDTRHFALFCPDLILNQRINIGDVYLKTVGKFNRQRVQVLTRDITGDNVYSMYTSRVARGYVDELPRILDQSYGLETGKEKLQLVDNKKIYKLESKFINNNQIAPEFGSFISRMKSMYEVFGEDRSVTDTSNTLNQFLSSNRTELMNAGIMINRNKLDPSNSNDLKPIIDADQTNFITEGNYSFSRNKVTQVPESINNQLPYLCSNLSMNSSPYIGMIFNEDIEYQGSGINDGMHNSIVNIFRFTNLQSYLQYILDEYDILNEEYNIIRTTDNWLGDGVADIYKGDLFSQKVFMRINRWTEEPDSYVDIFSSLNYEFAWKQGNGIYLYLQQTQNANLRVPTFDSTFYPYIKGESGLSTEESMKQFSWKSSVHKYLTESWNTNDGYNQLTSLFKFLAFDELQYNVSNQKPNRIQWSNKHISGAFIDQFRTFPLLQYQDIGIENGAILKLAKFNNTLFSIQESSINQHYQSERLQTTNDSSEIILGDRSLISDRIKQLADFGTQHKESVITSETSIYGVDWNKEKIWMIKGNATQSGSVYFSVEPIETSKTIADIFKELKSKMSNEELIQDLMGDIATGIHTAYDDTNKEVLFTFKLGLCPVENCDNEEEQKTYTLVYNELLNVFTGYYSYNKNIYIRFENKLLSFTKGNKKLWEHNTGDYQNIDGKIEPFVLEFIVNGASKEQNVVQYEKEFLAHILNASPMILDSVSWETEYQSSEKTPFINQQQFWSNPEYVEHNWNIPIMPNMDNNRGPVSKSDLNSFEKNSSMRGEWIKVKITYTPTQRESKEQQFYIRNIITNFIISFT